MPKKSLDEQAAALAAKSHKLKEPLVVDRAEALDPKLGKPIYRFKVVSATNANGPAYAVIANERGEHPSLHRMGRTAVRQDDTAAAVGSE